MISVISKTLGTMGMKLLASFLTEKVLAALMFQLLTKFAAKTDNKIDDKLVADVIKAYNGEL